MVLPATFFDVLMTFSPVKRLFFYQSPGITTDAFLTSHVPALRRSLSVALQYYLPVAGNLLSDLSMAYADGDSVSFVVAETDADFADCMTDAPKDVTLAHPLVPQLPLVHESGRTPLLAVQFTGFPGAGFTLGVTIHHAAADGSSSVRFIKSWAAIHRSGGDPSVVVEPPIYDRGPLLKYDDDRAGLLNDLHNSVLKEKLEKPSRDKPKLASKVRATFLLTRDQIDKLRHRIMSANGFRPSAFVSAASLVWACLTEARGHGDRIVYLTVSTDCRTRIDPPVPPAYFGNCLGSVYCEAVGSELFGQDGFVVAAKLLQAGLRSIQGRVVEAKMEVIRKLLKVDLTQARMLTMAGSPRFNVYGVDFGWGSPKKVEVISIEGGEAISLAESRDGEEGLELGLVGPAEEIVRFSLLFNNTFDRL